MKRSLLSYKFFSLFFFFTLIPLSSYSSIYDTFTTDMSLETSGLNNVAISGSGFADFSQATTVAAIAFNFNVFPDLFLFSGNGRFLNATQLTESEKKQIGKVLQLNGQRYLATANQSGQSNAGALVAIFEDTNNTNSFICSSLGLVQPPSNILLQEWGIFISGTNSNGEIALSGSGVVFTSNL